MHKGVSNGNLPCGTKSDASSIRILQADRDLVNCQPMKLIFTCASDEQKAPRSQTARIESMSGNITLLLAS